MVINNCYAVQHVYTYSDSYVTIHWNVIVITVQEPFFAETVAIIPSCMCMCAAVIGFQRGYYGLHCVIVILSAKGT